MLKLSHQAVRKFVVTTVALLFLIAGSVGYVFATDCDHSQVFSQSHLQHHEHKPGTSTSKLAACCMSSCALCVFAMSDVPSDGKSLQHSEIAFTFEVPVLMGLILSPDLAPPRATV